MKQLAKNYGKDVVFLAVVPTSFVGRAEAICRRYDLPMPVVAGEGEQLARACGVYATPQAALVDAVGKPYYRGNYNKSRYCTTAHSNYAQMAIDFLLAGTPAPPSMTSPPPPTAVNCQCIKTETGSGLTGWKD